MSRECGKTAAGNRRPKTPEKSAPREDCSLLPAGFVLYLGQKRDPRRKVPSHEPEQQHRSHQASDRLPLYLHRRDPLRRPGALGALSRRDLGGLDARLHPRDGGGGPGIPNSLFAINAYGKKRYRPLVCSFAALLIVLHLVVLPQLGTWYLILSPSIVLLVLMIVFSGVITEGNQGN